MAAGPPVAPSLSVVIPTYDRLPELQSVLGALAAQGAPGGGIEVVVVDDGSSDGTWEWLRDRHGEGVIALRQANAGPARARNRGVAAASGELVLFLGDDTVPQPGFLAAHLEAHRLGRDAEPVAVLGYTSFPTGWDSPFRRWINEFGAQFGYLLIATAAHVPFNFFYTSNVSLPRVVFTRLGGFREDFPAAAWEDIEFAYRATREGLTLQYVPRARTVHVHRVDPGTFCRRQRTSGRSAAIFAQLHPELEEFLGVHSPLPPAWRAAVEQRVLAAAVRLGEEVPGLVPAGAYERLLRLAYLRGLASGLQDLGRR
jgi:GT2 family glycosyltransferase